ncbi:isoprenyl transferase [Hyphomonas sp. FCG-A18]|jgi:undecaprenyl diphosphate synthase|uniref:isoprenyl transferase n=1 Tax=Hyphomonas sp. FCG-A18 TaxID=3080019 RepID=UPI002B31608B|nr:isoprenyl transferase [Hyphomonas sp. FCG-A18]
MSAAPAPTASNGDDVSRPGHVAIIMDGNGRWATSRGLPRAVGHERGVEALRRTVEAAQKLGLETLTVFSFSTENWRRPASEVSALFGLLKAYVKRDLDRLTREGVRIRVLGTRAGLPADILALVERAEQRTRDNAKFNLCIAFNYGGREELVRAAQAAIKAGLEGKLDPDSLNEDTFEQFLDTSDLPDPDLLIRTSGESRLSNFLIWQAAYTELVFMDVLWPDFGESHLREAIETYMARERRFGGLASGAA